MNIIEQAIRCYFEDLKRANYIKSFKRADNEGLDDYLELIDDSEQNNRLTL